MRKSIFIAFGAGILLVSYFSWDGIFGSKVDYNAEVKPILNKHCIGCHGGVKKAGDVSFLFEEDMLQPGKSGKPAVVRGNAHASEMIRRIETSDPDDRMPKNAEPLAQEDVDILKRWIDQGATWERHWAYKKVDRPELPSLRNLSNLFGLLDLNTSSWPQNAIDYFVLDRLRKEGLSPSEKADKATLIRRVSLDLTGLPPTPQQVADFVADDSDDAYERLVDGLLAAPSFGERWAAMWMDLARYADTKGYEKDGPRNIWRYRDYVVKAFNADKPFDTFTIEQLAGDLLPAESANLPSRENLVATGFHRNTMNNDEGGTVDEEFRVAAQIDRVNTTWEVWTGTTFACVQCHSHPYDPISHEEYYKYMAFFNNTRDEDVPTESPALRIYPSDDSLRVQEVLSWIEGHDAGVKKEFAEFLYVMEPKVNSHDFDSLVNATMIDGKYLGLKQSSSARLKRVTLTGKTSLMLSVSTGAEGPTLQVRTGAVDGPVRAQVRLTKPCRDSVLILPMSPQDGKHDLYFTMTSPKTPDRWVQIKWVSFQQPLPGAQEPGYEQVLRQYVSLVAKRVEEMPILWDGKGDLARKTHVFERGNWLVKGPEVQPGVPGLFPDLPAEAPKNRLGMAQWLVSRNHPLTARVIVNRFWEQIFGYGIVETVEDFGSQGSPPTHQQLLDWLAVSFMEDDGWSVKTLLKRIVLSATYQQSSQTNQEQLEKDPYNYWLSRGPRVRLSAEQVRDQALAISGLLSKKMYGPSVMPPQPDGIWQSPYSGERWLLSEGEDRYRRALYTYWKRTSPYPSMTTFDAPSREFCQSRRIRTNTPLQALVTLNDPVYMEASERLATLMNQKGKTPREQLKEGYQLLTFQPIEEQSLKVLEKVYHQALTAYRKNPAEVDSILVYGATKTPELAALSVSANVMLNLDTVVTKE
ncbi:cytochrome c [Dyadobacter jejuensis]|uniref:Cytochrome c n=1 Tax=Dyadobacter jejuensis TaxID=1082580 RepID=A0A316AFR6_9BACT|nr:DUF1553 domain-containing protein [Dyadobacter jejuensis]PWJ56626.1 cytochrome c [Dyadobacter jejuensis]